MPLNWNITKIKDWKVLDEAVLERVKTDQLVHLTMAAGLGEITEKNAGEFFERVRILEHVHGSFLHNYDGTPYHFTLADIVRRVGLHTNASTRTARQFDTQLMKGMRRAALHERHEQERAAVAPTPAPPPGTVIIREGTTQKGDWFFIPELGAWGLIPEGGWGETIQRASVARPQRLANPVLHSDNLPEFKRRPSGQENPSDEVHAE